MAEGSAMMLAWDSFGKNIPIKVIDHRRKVKMNMKFLLTFVVSVFSLLTMAGEDYGGKTALVADVKIAAGNRRQITTREDGNAFIISTKNNMAKSPWNMIVDLGRIIDKTRKLPWKSALEYKAEVPCKITCNIYTAMVNDQQIWGGIAVYVNDTKLDRAKIKMVKHKDPFSSSKKSKQSRKRVSPPTAQPGEVLINYENRAQFEVSLKAGETVRIAIDARAL